MERKRFINFSAYSKDLKANNGAPEQIKDIYCDMSIAFIKGIANELPLSSVIFDNFIL